MCGTHGKTVKLFLDNKFLCLSIRGTNVRSWLTSHSYGISIVVTVVDASHLIQSSSAGIYLLVWFHSFVAYAFMPSASFFRLVIFLCVWLRHGTETTHTQIQTQPTYRISRMLCMHFRITNEVIIAVKLPCKWVMNTVYKSFSSNLYNFIFTIW